MPRPHPFPESFLTCAGKGPQMRTLIGPWACLCLLSTTVAAHDTWVQTAARIVRPDDVVHVDLARVILIAAARAAEARAGGRARNGGDS